MLILSSLARPPGGCRDWTSQLSIRCPKAPQGWSHVRNDGIGLIYLADDSSFSTPSSLLPQLSHLYNYMEIDYSIPILYDSHHFLLCYVYPLRPVCSTPRSIPSLHPTASSSPPSSTLEPELESSTPPSDLVDTLVPVSERVPPRPECPPRPNGSDE